MGPESAGLESQATNNFMIDWNNQQLQRELSGLKGLTSADAEAGALGTDASKQFTGSQEMSALAPELLMKGAELPYQTTASLLDAGIKNATDFSSAEMATQFGPLGAIMEQIIPYLTFGAGARQN